MTEQTNLTQTEAMDISRMFPLEPMFNKVIITLNALVPDNNLVLSDNEMDPEQFIIAKGANVHNLNVNDKVIVDLERLSIKERNPHNQEEVITRIKLEPIFVGDKVYAIIEDRDIKAKYINQPLMNNE